MPRQPEVFVRELTPAEGERLVKITRTARDRVRLRRAGIVLASFQGRNAGEAAAMFAATAQYAREVIHAFNQQGFAALDPKWSGGRRCRQSEPPRGTGHHSPRSNPPALVDRLVAVGAPCGEQLRGVAARMLLVPRAGEPVQLELLPDLPLRVVPRRAPRVNSVAERGGAVRFGE